MSNEKVEEPSLNINNQSSLGDMVSDSTPLLPAIVPTNEEILITSYRQYHKALWKMLVFSAPYAAARLSSSIHGIGNALIISTIDQTSIAASPLITAFQFSVIGTARGILLSIGIEGGTLNGKGNYAGVGKLLSHSYVLAFFVSLPSAAIFLTSGPLLKAIHIDPNVADTVQGYFYGYTAGMLPLLLHTCDQQFSLAIKRQNISLFFGVSYTGISMLIGYPLVFGVLGLPKLGIIGIGIGSGSSAFINLIALRLYLMFGSTFKQYNLRKCCDFSGFLQNVSKLLKLGVPLGLQLLSEWGNLAVLSISVGLLGTKYLTASQASLQVLSAVNTTIIAFAQSSGVYVANTLGTARKELEHLPPNPERANMLCIHTRIMGNASIVIMLSFSVAIAVLFYAIPDQLTIIFAKNHGQDPSGDDILAISRIIFYINGAALITDAVRNGASGPLRGYKDVIFPPVISFITMSAVGLSVGYVLSVVVTSDVNWLFTTRAIGISLAAGSICVRWHKKGHGIFNEINDEISNRNLDNVDSKKSRCCNMFGFFKKNTASIQEEATTEKNSRCVIL